jgi:hypothetical protein
MSVSNEKWLVMFRAGVAGLLVWSFQGSGQDTTTGPLIPLNRDTTVVGVSRPVSELSATIRLSNAEAEIVLQIYRNLLEAELVIAPNARQALRGQRITIQPEHEPLTKEEALKLIEGELGRQCQVAFTHLDGNRVMVERLVPDKLPRSKRANRPKGPWPPPFVAEGSLMSSNSTSIEEAKLSFYASNRWWQVQLTNYTMPMSPHLMSMNAMSIPGGVRHLIYFSGTKTPSAEACPIDFPPPGIAGGLFEVWLALRPDPNLPLIDDREMHPFLMVPSAPFGLLKDAINHGQYHARYIEPGGFFLAELDIQNDGARLIWNPDENEIDRYPPPFANGFKEFEYRVLEATNIHGLGFPLRSVLKRFGPDPANQKELVVTMFTEIRIANISFQAADLSRQVHPARVTGLDYRPRHLRGREDVGIDIINDVWPPAGP